MYHESLTDRTSLWQYHMAISLALTARFPFTFRKFVSLRASQDMSCYPISHDTAGTVWAPGVDGVPSVSMHHGDGVCGSAGESAHWRAVVVQG